MRGGDKRCYVLFVIWGHTKKARLAGSGKRSDIVSIFSNIYLEITRNDFGMALNH